MHDPLVVAHEIPSPIPHRKPWKDRDRQARRWGFARSRRTNTENLGQPVYRWWRPKGWTLYLGGRAIAGRLPTFVSESGIVTEVRVGLTPAERDALVAEVRRLRDALVGIASGGCAECTSAPGWSGCPEDDACDACTARYALEASDG